MTAVSRQLLPALGEDLALPPAWRELAARAHATVEQRWLLGQLGRRLLVCTPAARARLRSWLDRQRAAPAVPLSPQRLRRVIRDEVMFFGDLSMLAPVVEALVHVPPPVRAAALAECVFLPWGRRRAPGPAPRASWTVTTRPARG
jgi:hypothetical protein